MAQSTPTNLYCSRASFGCAYMHHIEKYVFQQKFYAPGSGLLLERLSPHTAPPGFWGWRGAAGCLRAEIPGEVGDGGYRHSPRL